jgi:NTP pyrophosphatase (non-canonical NTP hydrolase)
MPPDIPCPPPPEKPETQQDESIESNNNPQAEGAPMTLAQYQQQAMTTCLPESENFSYMMLNLVGEVGELASKVAKMIRKGGVEFLPDGDITLYHSSDPEADRQREEEMQLEAGDILWQLSGLCSVMGWQLEDIARQNLTKLADRKARHVIDGNGDHR